MPAADLTAGMFKLQFQALGTQCMVQFRTHEIEAAKVFRAAVLTWMKEFENTWSRFKPDSLLCKINQCAGKERIALTPEQDHVIALCAHTYARSRGVIDPTSFSLTRLWDEAEKKEKWPTEEKIQEALKRVAWPEVEYEEGSIFLPRGMALEIGGFGKEYAVDQLIALAQRGGIQDALVDLGRDVAAIGAPAHGPFWVVGAEDAQELDTPIHRLAITDRALATSGNGRRFRHIAGKKLGHLIDSRTGYPAETGVLTATCLANDCLTAGLLSTCACILGLEEGMQRVEQTLHAEALLQTAGKTFFSRNLHQHLLAS